MTLIRDFWRGALHLIGLAPLSEVREAEEDKRRAFEAAVHARVAGAERSADQRLAKMRQVEKAARSAMQSRKDQDWIEKAAREAMQNQERTEPCRDGDPHDF